MRFLALLLFAACVNGAIPERVEWPILAYPLNETTLDRPDVAAAFDSLLRTAGYGRLGEERAGFLIFDQGQFRLELWPPSHQFHREEWAGKIPTGTVAVVHTHPPELPAPSVQDRVEAQRIGVPIIVVTIGSVAIATEDGSVRRLRLGMTATKPGVEYTDRR